MNEYEQHDLEVEIIDLDQGKEALPEKSLTPPKQVQPRFSQQQHRVQLVVSVSVVIVALFVLLGSSPSVQTLVPTLLGIHPTPTVVPGADLFYIDAQPVWGQLMLDGKPLPHIPMIGTEAPLRFPLGKHTLEWRVAPFLTQRCLLSVPPNFATDTCNARNSVTNTNASLGAWLVTFSASLDTLPDAQRLALVNAAQAALDAQQSTERVQTGEYYALSSVDKGFTEPVQARQPLLATLHFQLNTNTNINTFCTNNGVACTIGTQDCRLFCTVQGILSPTSKPTTAWTVLSVVRTAWTYTTENGKEIARDQIDMVHTAAADEHLVPLVIRWDNAGWHVTSPFASLIGADLFHYDPVCASARDEVRQNPLFSQSSSLSGFANNWHYVSSVQHAVGCLAFVVLPSSFISPSSSIQPIVAFCLHRFGVFLAVNDVAHTLWPTLPRADTYEQNIARQLLPATLAGEHWS